MRLACAAFLLALAPAAGAGDFTKDAIGTTGSEFLLMDLGARGIAMGGAYTAVTNDATSLYWNPAGLTKIPRFSAAFMYTDYVQGISYQSAEVASRLNDTGVLAGGFRYRDVGSITGTDLAGNTLGTFNPRDYVLEGGWGQSIFDLSDSEVDVNMGVVGRWIHSDYLLQADGYGGDLGIQSRFYTGPYAYDVGFVAQNIGVGQKFDQRRDTLPFRMRLGGAISPMRSLLISAEGVMPSNNVAYAALGFEYTMEFGRNMKAALRGGFNSLTLESLGVPTAASGGVGLSIGNITFDYAFVPFGVLGNSIHRFSVSFNLPAKASRRYRER